MKRDLKTPFTRRNVENLSSFSRSTGHSQAELNPSLSPSKRDFPGERRSGDRHELRQSSTHPPKSSRESTALSRDPPNQPSHFDHQRRVRGLFLSPVFSTALRRSPSLASCSVQCSHGAIHRAAALTARTSLVLRPLDQAPSQAPAQGGVNAKVLTNIKHPPISSQSTTHNIIYFTNFTNFNKKLHPSA